MRSGQVQAVLGGFSVLFVIFALILFPEYAFRASVSGLKLFFDVVFPSLLPFFILSEVLLAYGMVHFLGVFFEPIMRPLFNVPGVGSFVLSMGLAAGYPMDAVLTAKFRRQGLCTKVEGERLLAFTNTADPLFIFGAVAVGMFGMPALGLVLALAHYIGAFLVGLCFRFWGRETPARPPQRTTAPAAAFGLVRRAFRELFRARAEDGRALGVLLNDAIREAVATLFMIMSFIVLFSVIIQVFDHIGVVGLLSIPLGALLRLLGLSPHLTSALLQGLFEIDLGSAAAAHAAAPFVQRLMVAAGIIAWSGLSVHGQVASVLTGTDISMRPYFLARALHAVFAALLTVLLLGVMPLRVGHAVLPAMASFGDGFAMHLGFASLLGGGLLLGLGLFGGLYAIARGLRVVRLRWR